MRTEEEIDAYDFLSSPLVNEDGYELWEIWYPKREDVLTILNAIPDKSMRWSFTMKVKDVLLPFLDSKAQYEAIAWHFRNMFPSYNWVWTKPEMYKDAPIIKGLRS